MSPCHAPRCAIALLEHFVEDSAPLAGDLIEEFERRQSRAWLWWQVLGAVAASWINPSAEIRPLRLVELQPTDAVDRARRLDGRVRPVNLSASPLPGVGGIGLVVLMFHVTVVAPAVWWALLGSAVAGVLMGLVLIRKHATSPGTTPQSLAIRPF